MCTSRPPHGRTGLVSRYTTPTPTPSSSGGLISVTLSRAGHRNRKSAGSIIFYNVLFLFFLERKKLQSVRLLNKLSLMPIPEAEAEAAALPCRHAALAMTGRSGGGTARHGTARGTPRHATRSGGVQRVKLCGAARRPSP